MTRLRLPLLTALLALLWSGASRPNVQAQDAIRLHGHPQKSAYGSSAEWPFEDAQCHVLQTPSDLTSTTLSHVHIGLRAPKDGEITGPVRVTGELKMFQLAGRVDDHFVGTLSDVIFDDSGTASPGILRGDPNGLIVQTFSATLNTAGWIAHGWIAPQILLRTFLDNGQSFDTQFNEDFYSLLDPTVPETNASPRAAGPYLASHCVYSVPGSQGMGVQATEVFGFAPLLPISTPWPIGLTFYTYGSSFQGELAPAFSEISLDANLHMGNEGTQVFTNTVSSTNPDPGSGPFFSCDTPTCTGPNDRPYLIDPAGWTQGTHTLNFRWKQPTGAGSAHFLPHLESWSLMLISVPVGMTTPPPSNPCVTDPLQAAVSVTGINYAVVSWTGVVTATDTRGCTATVSR